MPMFRSDSFDLSAASPAVRPLAEFIERLRSWLTAGHAPSLPFEHALAALLVHAAALRGPVSPSRERRIAAVLREHLGRDECEIAGLIAAAGREDARAVDLHHFARVINRRLAQQGRLAVLAMAAQVAFADDAGAEEEGFLRLLGGLLGVSDHDRGVVQHRARASRDGSLKPDLQKLKPRESSP